jgi:hypothetical protein
VTCTACDPLRVSHKRCEEEPPNCYPPDPRTGEVHRFRFCCDCDTRIRPPAWFIFDIHAMCAPLKERVTLMERAATVTT